MEMQEVISRAERNIRQALRDYGAHTSQTDVLDDVTDEFIYRLAADSSYAKQGLRKLFSKSPVWNEELTLDKFLRGLALAIESGAPVTIDAESGYIDTSDVDAECADMIIQFALFGDLVFG